MKPLLLAGALIATAALAQTIPVWNFSAHCDDYGSVFVSKIEVVTNYAPWPSLTEDTNHPGKIIVGPSPVLNLTTNYTLSFIEGGTNKVDLMTVTK